MPRIQLCNLDDLETIDSRGFEIKEAPYNIFIVRNGNKVSAYQNSCPHNLAPLNWAPDVFLSYDKDYIQCANHGALFEIDSGQCIYGPCIGQKLMPIDTKIIHGIIHVEV